MNSLPNIRERVGYIDAMRGFMMLLVVYSHILYFGYGSLFLEHRTSFNDVFTIIYMPLFFFISGFVSKYKLINLLPYLINKFKTLIIPTVFFLIIYLLLLNCTFIPIIMSESKGGYWLTITLFEFFVIYAIGNFFSQKLTVNERWQDFFLVIGALITYAVSAPSFSVRLLGLDYDIVTALGITQWRFYIFFMVGVLFHKHSVWFEKLLDNSWVIGFVIVSFFLIVLYYCQDGYKPIGAIYHLFFIFLGVSGIIVVFAFFRKYQSTFTNTPIGKGFQSIGIRTQDIYLLHYFFLPRHLHHLGDYFSNNPIPVVEFFISSAITIMVVLVCLVMSKIIRISDLLGSYLLGAKRTATVK